MNIYLSVIEAGAKSDPSLLEVFVGVVFMYFIVGIFAGPLVVNTNSYNKKQTLFILGLWGPLAPIGYLIWKAFRWIMNNLEDEVYKNGTRK